MADAVFSLSTPVIGFGFVRVLNSHEGALNLVIDDEDGDEVADFELSRDELDDLISMLEEARQLQFG